LARHKPAALLAGLFGSLVLAMMVGLAGTGAVQAQEAQAIDPMPFETHAQELRFQDLASELRCLVCQDENLLHSNADLARQMRQLVFDKMQAGWSDEEIKQYLVSRYSEYVLYQPRMRPG